jgi:hypothetical protein
VLVLALAAALLPAAVAGASPRQVGRYSGQLVGGDEAAPVTFHVKRAGRLLTGFKTTVSAFCVGPTIDTNRIAILVAYVPRAKIRPDGRFAKTYRTDGGGTYKVSGTLRGRKVRDGKVSLQLSTCSGQSGWTARRAGR